MLRSFLDSISEGQKTPRLEVMREEVVMGIWRELSSRGVLPPEACVTTAFLGQQGGCQEGARRVHTLPPASSGPLTSC